MKILESSAGQKYAVDDDFRNRLESTGVIVWSNAEGYGVEGSLADLLDFLTKEGLI